METKGRPKGCRGAGAYLRQSMSERQGTPWTGRKSIDPFIPKGNLERPINRQVLDCGRKPEYPKRTHACTGRTCKIHAVRPPARSRSQDLLAARQQCFQLLYCAARLFFQFF
ncbi:hypothetical protein XENOCAPTIV_027105 [Xenoophorus captivus]|uniref:Uncharacterized protein n=1 Tax=Xenoophorus captivus TaxID=1517983 RepID=A0ABV0R6A4_9TELE